MPGHLARLHVKIRREGAFLHVRVISTANGASAEKDWDGSGLNEWSRVEAVTDRIFGLIGENNLRRKLENAHTSLVALGQELFRTAFPGAAGERIRRSESEFLLFELNANTLGISWELAHDGTDFLGARFSVGRKVVEWEPDLSLVRPRPVGKCSTLILSNPSGDLSTATQEGEFLSELLSRDLDQEVVWLNGRVECEDLKQWLPRADILHYCGHFEDSTEKSSGWKLADREFTRDDLQESKEKGQSPPLLVFNNACHSGPAAPDEHPGYTNAFAGSFLKMGCVHYIGAYLKVLDRQASEFARVFYKEALRGVALGTALRQARLEFRSEHAADQLSWAQYVLYGDPTKGLLGKTALSPEVHAIVFGDSDLGNELARETQTAFPDSETILCESGVFAILFQRPSEAARYSLLLQARFRASDKDGKPTPPRLAVASGEVLVERSEDSGKAVGVQGYVFDVGLSLLSLAQTGQILTTRPAHENARAVFRGAALPGSGKIVWLDHGSYVFDSLEDPIEVCEVGAEEGGAPLRPPRDTEHARRSISPDQESVLGWRPALDTEIPTSPEWILLEKLGAGGFGEVWRARNRETQSTRVFKFCFRADRVRSLKREVTLFRVLRDRLGPHPHIVRIHDVFFEEPPFYISMEDIQGLDLGKWLARYCGDERIDEGVRLEIVAKVADALQAAHDAGVIHRDVKPSNILVEGTPDTVEGLNIKLTDFGIGRLESKQSLVDITAMGFTETYRPTEMSSGSGSRLYMAPELLVGKESSIRSDIYSLGMVLYQILLKDCDRPLTVDWEREIGDPILLEDLRRCLSGEASERYSSAGEVAERLRSVEERRQARRREEDRSRAESRRKRLARAGIGVAALSLLLAAALGYGLRQAWIERENLERSLYHLQIQEAQRVLEDSNTTHAREILYACPERFRAWEWGYLAFKCNTDFRAFALKAPIVSVDLSPDNRYLAAGAEDGSVQWWDFVSGESLWEIHLSDQPIQAIAFDAESKRIAFSDPKEIQVWGLEDRKRISTFKAPNGYQGALRYAPDRALLAATDDRGSLWLYDLSEGSTREIQTPHTGKINDFVITPDGSKAITGGEDSHCRLIDIQTGSILGRAELSDHPLTAVAINQKGDRIAALSNNHLYSGTVEPFDLAVSVYQVGGVGGGLDFSPNGRYLGANLDNHRVEIMDLGIMGTPSMRRGGRGGPRSIRFTRDGRFLLTIDEDGQIRQRPIRPGEEWTLNLNGHLDWVHCLAFSPDGQSLATGSEDETVVVWDTKTGSVKKSLLTYSNVERVAFDHDGGRLGAVTAKGEVFVWNPLSGATLKRFTAHEGRITGFDFTPFGEGFATKGDDGAIRVWSMKEEASTLTVEAAPGEVLSYSPDGKALLSNGENFSLQEWDSNSGKRLANHAGHKREVRTLDFFPDGNRFASGDEGGEIIVWDRQSGRRISSFDSLVGLTHELIVTPDSRRIITSVEIWDLENLRSIMPIPVDTKALSPDGRLLAIGGALQRLRIEGAFPYRSGELSNRVDLSLEGKIEQYKRDFWRDRPSTATGSLSPQGASAENSAGITGCWNFEMADLTATSGRDLEYFGLTRELGKASTGFGKARSFGLPGIGGEDCSVLYFSGPAKEAGYRLFSNAGPQYGNHLLAYTILLDLFYPKESGNLRRALYNTDSSNSTAAELVVSSTGGLGVDGVYHGAIEPGKWHRVVCSVNLTGEPKMAKFVDGQHVGTQVLSEGEEGRWAIAEGRRGRSILILAGRDCDDAPCFLNSVQFRDYTMMAEEVASLGGAMAAGIPIGEVKD